MEPNQKDELYRIFPTKIRSILDEIPWYRKELEEIRLRVLQPPVFCYRPMQQTDAAGRYFHKEVGSSCGFWEGSVIFPQLSAVKLDPGDMAECFEYLCEYSKYAYKEQLQQGFLALPGGIRVGVAGQTGGTYPMFFNIRIPGEQRGCGRALLPYLLETIPGSKPRIHNTLVIAPPGAGKTTLLRDLLRLLSEAGAGNISLMDERYEIAAGYQGVPQMDVGSTTDIYGGCEKHSGCIRAVRSMAPDLLAVDEIGDGKDALALAYARTCGVGILATIHGATLEDYRKKQEQEQVLATLAFQRYVLIGRDPEGNRRYQLYDKEGRLLWDDS
jgi:stage III sporulation protein AA